MNLLISDHAIERFIERSPNKLGEKPRAAIRDELRFALSTAKKLPHQTANGSDLWHLTDHDLYACVAVKGKHRHVLTVLTSEMAQVMAPRSGPNSTERPTLTSSEIAIRLAIAQEEKAVSERSTKDLEAALKQRMPAHIPPEYWEACVTVVQSPDARTALLQIAQTETARVREVEKTARHMHSQDYEQKIAIRIDQFRATLAEAFATGTLADAYAVIAASTTSASLVDGIAAPPTTKPQFWPADAPAPPTPLASLFPLVIEHTVKVQVEFMGEGRVPRLGRAPEPDRDREDDRYDQAFVKAWAIQKAQESIRAAREYLGLSQRELAIRLRVSQSTLSRYERDNTAPAPVLERLRAMILQRASRK